MGREMPDAAAYQEFDKQSKHGQDMSYAQGLLASAVASIVGKTEDRAIESLFTPGGTHALKGEFTGSNDFEVIAYLAITSGASL